MRRRLPPIHEAVDYRAELLKYLFPEADESYKGAGVNALIKQYHKGNKDCVENLETFIGKTEYKA